MKKIFYNGEVYTVTDGMKQAFVVEDGKFKFVGTNQEALNFKEKNSEIFDLRGKFVTPGFNDSHLHIISTGNCLNMVDLYDANSIEDIIQRGKRFVEGKQYNSDHYVMGFGWNDDYIKEKRFPNRYELDKISTEYPICFIRVCYHIYVVNSKALELAGIDKNTPQVEGGVFDLDGSGEPLGIFRENACELITSKITPLEFREIKESIMNGIQYCNSKGITSIGTDDLSEFANVSYKEIIKAFQELEQEGNLNARVNQQSRFHSIKEFKAFLADGYKTGTGSDFFKIGPLKLISDGALGARTAYMKEPYSDAPETRGVLALSQEKLDEWVKLGHNHGMQIAIHAIGDGAMYNSIRAYSKIIKNFAPNNYRHGIVHAQITDAYVLEKMLELSLIAYIQTIFIDYDVTIAKSRLGDRCKDSYRFKTMLDRGIPASNGSDSPVEWPDVFKGMQLAITRAPIIDSSKPFMKQEALTMEQAIYSYTYAGAYASFEEEKKGSIEAGKYADFVIVGQNLFQKNPEDVHLVNPEQTWLNGEIVWTQP
ncbi:MAG: amidohydrolase [Clostridia bacterium]|nr:amidohydrolase [Clostridia bacterium]